MPQPCPETRPWSGCVDLRHVWSPRGAGWPSAPAPAPLLGWLLPESWAERGRPRPAASTEPPLPPGQTRDRTGGSAPEDKGPLGFPSCQTQSRRIWDPGGAPHTWPRFHPFPRCLEETSGGRLRSEGRPGAACFAETHKVISSLQAPGAIQRAGPGGVPARPPWSSVQALRSYHVAQQTDLSREGQGLRPKPAQQSVTGVSRHLGQGGGPPDGAWRAALSHAWSQASATHLTHLVPGISCPPSSRAAGHHGHAASLVAYR